MGQIQRSSSLEFFTGLIPAPSYHLTNSIKAVKGKTPRPEPAVLLALIIGLSIDQNTSCNYSIKTYSVAISRCNTRNDKL